MMDEHGDGGEAGDSPVPGILGITLSGATILTFVGRIYFNHRYNSKMKARQMALKQQIEAILSHLEYSEANCSDMRKELTTLIGQRATGEFLQLWQSSHQLASNNRSNISMIKNLDINNVVLSTNK